MNAVQQEMEAPELDLDYLGFSAQDIEEMKAERAELESKRAELEEQLPALESAWRSIPVAHTNKGPDPEASKRFREANSAASGAKARVRAYITRIATLSKEIEHAEKVAGVCESIRSARTEEADAKARVRGLRLSLEKVEQALGSLQQQLQHEAAAAAAGEQAAAEAIAKATASGDAKAEKAAQSKMDEALSVTKQAGERARSRQSIVVAFEKEAQDLRSQIEQAKREQDAGRVRALKMIQIALQAEWDMKAGHLAAVGAKLRWAHSEIGYLYGLGLSKLHIPLFAPRAGLSFITERNVKNFADDGGQADGVNKLVTPSPEASEESAQ